MNFAVFGATGRTGVELVGQALELGHRVRALVRSPAKAAAVLPHSDRLVTVEGDLLDEAAVGKVIDGADAVINLAGHVKGSPPDLQQRAVAAILTAMSDRGVDRLVTLTGAGVRADGDRPKLVDRLFGTALRLVQPALLADSVAAVDHVRRSDTRWTVVRAPRLTDREATGAYRVVPNVGAGSGVAIARGDLAKFLIDEVNLDQYVGRMPVVSA